MKQRFTNIQELFINHLNKKLSKKPSNFWRLSLISSLIYCLPEDDNNFLLTIFWFSVDDHFFYRRLNEFLQTHSSARLDVHQWNCSRSLSLHHSTHHHPYAHYCDRFRSVKRYGKTETHFNYFLRIKINIIHSPNNVGDQFVFDKVFTFSSLRITWRCRLVNKGKLRSISLGLKAI